MKALLLVWALPLWAGTGRTPSADGGATCSDHPCTIAVTCATSTCAVTDIQTAINEAVGGDTITLQAGKTWITRGGQLQLKSGKSSTVTIRTSASDAVLPAIGQMVTPSYGGRGCLQHPRCHLLWHPTSSVG